MAGDWIKFEATTSDKPEVVRIAAMLGIDQDAVVGKLLRLWVWADQNSVDGNGVTVTSAFLDRLTFCPNFAHAMREVGWLVGTDGALALPNFGRHNGKTAKERAVSNRRVAKHRNGNGSGNAVATENVTAAPLQKPLPEKRREEKKEQRATPLERQAARFEEFWSVYPNRKGKTEALAKWKARGLDKIADRIIADVQARIIADRDWLRGYAPHGSTYVNGAGWEDAIVTATHGLTAANDVFAGAL